jgi:hypothetical protein
LVAACRNSRRQPAEIVDVDHAAPVTIEEIATDP